MTNPVEAGPASGLNENDLLRLHCLENNVKLPATASAIYRELERQGYSLPRDTYHSMEKLARKRLISKVDDTGADGCCAKGRQTRYSKKETH